MEVSPSPVYGARLLSGLRLKTSRGFKSRHLRRGRTGEPEAGLRRVSKRIPRSLARFLSTGTVSGMTPRRFSLRTAVSCLLLLGVTGHPAVAAAAPSAPDAPAWQQPRLFD